MQKHQRFNKIILLVITIIPITVFWGCQSDTAPTMLEFQTIEQGDFSGISSQINWPIRNQSDWESFWAEHKGTVSPVPELPTVDFSTEMVIGVFDQRPTSGFSVEITRIEETSKTIIVSVTSTGPGGGVTLQVLTQPFHIVKTSSSTKPIEVQRTVR